MIPAGAPDGLAVIDKPAGWTSHDVVAKCRGILGTRKVGHSGTLDPMATGVLVLGVGRCTRLLTFVSGASKRYEAEITFAVETDSLDADGTVTVVHKMTPPSPAAVVDAASALTGNIRQVPPMVSAVKVGGRRLHELAREGVDVPRAARPVTVHTFEVHATADPMVFDAVIECTSGTYVRVLAADLGRALGGGAHLSSLRRSAVGPFTIGEATDLEQVQLLAPSAIARVLASVTVDADLALEVGHGRRLRRDRLSLGGSQEGPWAVLDAVGELLAVYVTHGEDGVKPAVVLG